MEGRTAELQRSLLLAQTEVASLREEVQIQEVLKATLQSQLAGRLPNPHAIHLRMLSDSEQIHLKPRPFTLNNEHIGWSIMSPAYICYWSTDSPLMLCIDTTV